MKYNIFIEGSYGKKNFGDDLLLQQLVKAFHESKIVGKIYAFGEKDSYLQRFTPEVKLINPYLPYNIEVDLFLYGGGTQFFSFSTHGISAKMAIFKKFLILAFRHPIYYILKCLKPFIRKGLFNIKSKKYLAIGIGFGPYYSQAIEKSHADKLLNTCDFVSVRDIISYKKLLKYNKSTFLYLHTDICYLYNNKGIELNTSSSIKSIGMIVRDWDHNAVALNYQIIQGVTVLRELGFQVAYILLKGKSDKKWFVQLKKMKENIVIWNQLDEVKFLNTLSSFNLIISARYHGLIFASLLNIPFISIEIEPKLKLIAEEYSDACYLWKPPYSIEDLIKAINDLNNNYHGFKNRIRQICNQKKQVAKEMMKEFYQFLILNEKNDML